MENEAFDVLKKTLLNKISLTIPPPYIHFQNAAERAIKISKTALFLAYVQLILNIQPNNWVAYFRSQS